MTLISICHQYVHAENIHKSCTSHITCYAQGGNVLRGRIDLQVMIHMVGKIQGTGAFKPHPLFPLFPRVVPDSHKSFQVVRQVILKLPKLLCGIVKQCLQRQNKKNMSLQKFGDDSKQDLRILNCQQYSNACAEHLITTGEREG